MLNFKNIGKLIQETSNIICSEDMLCVHKFCVRRKSLPVRLGVST